MFDCVAALFAAPAALQMWSIYIHTSAEVYILLEQPKPPTNDTILLQLFQVITES